MILLKIFFWASLAIVFYTYIGYGLVLWIYLKLRGSNYRDSNLSSPPNYPNVTVVIATYNEEEIIKEKLSNCKQLIYPAGKIKFLVVADGSHDSTVDIVQGHPEFDLWFKPERAGKTAAINRVMPHIQSEITVFTDANTLLNPLAIQNLARHFNDPDVGAVAGEKKIKAEGTATAGAGEGLYWKYESFLKTLDSRFYSVVGAAGELFSIRTHLYEQVEPDVLLDDFIISMRICQRGYRVMYEPAAFATEAPSFSIKEEQKRKIRIAAGGFQSVLMLKPLLNILKYGKLSFQYISHRVLRWILCPILLPVAFFLNLGILITSGGMLYTFMLLAQVLFYLAAFAGWVASRKNRKIPGLYVIYYFVFMNVSMYHGFIRFRRKSQSVLWDKAKRA